MIHLLDFLVCDDVREEKSGKYTLVGIYADGIIVTTRGKGRPHLPKLGMFVRVGFGEDETIPNAFRFEASTGKATFLRIEGVVESIEPNRILAFGVVGGPVPLEPSVPLKFDLRFLQGKETTSVPVPDMSVTFSVEAQAED
jgi:hypothetical protein